MYDYEALLWAAVALPIVGSIAIGSIVMVACIMAGPSENYNEFTDRHRDQWAGPISVVSGSKGPSRTIESSD